VRKKFVGNAPKLSEPKLAIATETRSFLHPETMNIELKEALEETEAKLSKSKYSWLTDSISKKILKQVIKT
jgi:phage gp29-like protein